jgi:Zn-finger nucleic acid-binding protein
LSDSKSSDEALPQDAYRNVPFTEEDAYFAEQEKITLELLKKERDARANSERRCLTPACEKTVMEQVNIDSIEIDKCPKCGGVWLDPGELELLVKRSKGSKNALVKFFYGLAGRYDD